MRRPAVRRTTRGHRRLQSRRSPPGPSVPTSSPRSSRRVRPARWPRTGSVGGRELRDDRLLDLVAGLGRDHGLVDRPHDRVEPLEALEFPLAGLAIADVPTGTGKPQDPAVVVGDPCAVELVGNPPAVFRDEGRFGGDVLVDLEQPANRLGDPIPVLGGDEREGVHLGQLRVGVARHRRHPLVPLEVVLVRIERVDDVRLGLEDALGEDRLLAEGTFTLVVFGAVVGNPDVPRQLDRPVDGDADLVVLADRCDRLANPDAFAVAPETPPLGFGRPLRSRSLENPFRPVGFARVRRKERPVVIPHDRLRVVPGESTRTVVPSVHAAVRAERCHRTVIDEGTEFVDLEVTAGSPVDPFVVRRAAARPGRRIGSLGRIVAHFCHPLTMVYGHYPHPRKHGSSSPRPFTVAPNRRG